MASFIKSGKTPSEIDWLKVAESESTSAELAILTNFVEIPKISVVLLDFRDFMIRLISCGVVSLRNREHLFGFFR